jgi:protein involved in polysaccharide export with SLBB domain
MIGHLLTRAAALALALILAGCAGGGGSRAPLPTTPTPAATPPAELSVSSYRLGSGDRVRIVVFRHEDLSGEFALDGAGNFAMPLVGEIQAYGLTTRELEQRIAAKLQDGYLVEPQVSVEVLNYRPFYILGEVRQPGSYQYVNGMTVLNAVALAGGFTYRGKQDEFLLQRGGSNTQATEVGIDTPILPGDVVTVQERFF